MPFETHELDRIKAAVAEAIATTGAAAGVHSQLLQPIAAFALQAIDTAATADDPRPFAPGKRVRSTNPDTPEQLGTVVRTLEHEGEVHTIVVRWDGWNGDSAMSPREVTTDLDVPKPTLRQHAWVHPNGFQPVSCARCGAPMLEERNYTEMGYVQARDREDCRA